MKIFGFNLTLKDYKGLYFSKCEEIEELESVASRSKRECEEAHLSYCNLQRQYNETIAKNKDLQSKVFITEEDVKELRHRLEDVKSANVELNERIEKEMSDNCELQNLYAEKCKECEALKTETDIDNMTIDDLIQKKEALAEKLKAYEQDGYVVVKEDHYNKLKDVYEKKQIENETRNANRRKRRAAKKVAQGKP